MFEEIIVIVTLIITVIGVSIQIVFKVFNKKSEERKEKEISNKLMDNFERKHKIFLDSLFILTPITKADNPADNPEKIKLTIQNKNIEKGIDEYIKSARIFIDEEVKYLSNDNSWEIRDTISLAEKLKKDINALMGRESDIVRKIMLERSNNNLDELEKKISKDIIKAIEGILSCFNSFEGY